ncbi:biotin--[acetyl-CoA-carboxylase] ligase [Candidatus Azobacteroides pseudotrichonymphae]|uniref:Biotin-[acetyl-CoA-carboxylase] ligase n=1 Tax=Azobacteroides pseudotrichonymphae genomovar. CFP2 TaxID=511995 RepID=B6YQU2_AZOPC|nr:biotin--[acetyl-CoA-carboxylase] ligase [Candidatus Azobacteroides pseudotrichonymphae]BAG83564.1 biotin-[acetyl-CoA-carboxylase] ligase [Candidatus Azobacteroides pseudotrichonymphae genomovar. CFP2]
MNTIKIKITSSTNLFLKELSKKQSLKEWTIVVAESQTAGRGQRGNCWESEPTKNIICSILLYPNFLSIQQQFLLSEVVVIGIKDVLDTYVQKGIAIKWPNDVFFEKRKLAGILIENELIGQKISCSIIGIGLNVNQQVFKSEAPNPVSLKQIIGIEMNTNILLEQIVSQIQYWYKKLKSGQRKLISQVYHDSLYCKEGFHFYKDKNEIFQARIRMVTEEGLLCLMTKSKEERYYSFKEISLL